MRDVAERAGVSISTVSFIVNGTKDVTPATRRRVEQAMAELGFRRNVLARALASRETKILALVVPAVEHRLGPTALDIVTSAAVEAAHQGFNLALWPVSNDGAELDEYVASGLVDGLLLMEVQFDDPRVERLRALETPCVLIGRTEEPDALNWVDMDFDAAVHDAIDHLTSRGHRRIALVIGNADESGLPGYGPVVRVERAYRDRAAALGYEPVVVRCDHGAAAGRHAAASVFASDPSTTAVLVMNEDAAFGLTRGIVDSGRTIPDDVSVVSLVTSSRTAALVEPGLTAMVAPGQSLGRIAVDSLVRSLRGELTERVHTLVPCTLEVAGSSGPAPAGA